MLWVPGPALATGDWQFGRWQHVQNYINGKIVHDKSGWRVEGREEFLHSPTAWQPLPEPVR